MRKLFTIALAVFAVFAANAQSIGLRSMNWTEKPQVSSKSLDVKNTNNKLSVLWLRDGLSNDYTALSYPLFQVTGLGTKVNIVSLGAYDSRFSKTTLWGGLGLSVQVLESNGWSVSLYGAYKGLNFGNNFRMAEGREGWVYGLGFSVPIK